MPEESNEQTTEREQRATAAVAEAEAEERQEAEREHEEQHEQESRETDKAASTIKTLRAANERLETRIKEFEDRDKSDQEKLSERVTTAETDAAQWKRAALVATVARQKDLPDVLADRLKGETLEELSKDADRLLEQIGERDNGERDRDLGAGPRGSSRAGSMDSLIRRAAGR